MMFNDHDNKKTNNHRISNINRTSLISFSKSATSRIFCRSFSVLYFFTQF
jgi:hypothetical protein